MEELRERIVHGLGREPSLELLDLAHLALELAIEPLELAVEREAFLALALGAVARLARVPELVLDLEQVVLGAGPVRQPLLAHLGQADLPPVRVLPSSQHGQALRRGRVRLA
ncbi:MAG: hypothetical protein IPG84_13650 [Betaproteobacteria bacterium]|nr:hypothetical protein [Betaproteobacteria bacterium]